MLRFLEERSLREVGQTLGISEEAARKRVDRGLEKLRAVLARRGIASTAALLSAVLTTNAIQAAPAGFAGSIASGISSAGFAAPISTLAKSTLAVMARTKAKAIALIAGVICLCGASATYVVTLNPPASGSMVEEVRGAGLALGRDKKTGEPTIMIVVPGSAPALAGLSKGLLIHAINGVPTAALTIPECLRRFATHRVIRLELIDPVQGTTNAVDYNQGGADQSMGGIGVSLGRDRNAPTTIVAVVPGSAAENAGLFKGLVIEAIDGVPTAGLTPRDCLNRIQGPPGSAVRLRVIDPSRDATNMVTVNRYRL